MSQNGNVYREGLNKKWEACTEYWKNPTKELRENQPRLLAIWGKNDPSFVWAGALAFKKDLPDARVIGVESGHFALENCCDEIVEEIRKFF